MNSQSKFLTLPPELREHAAVEMQPADLLSLSQTCKELHQFMSSKRIWAIALRSMCRKYGLFEPSFPDESMDLVDIQRAALGPALWHRRIIKLTSPPSATDDNTQTLGLQPRTQTTIEVRSAYPHVHLPDSFRQIYIVPGGRWLVGLTSWCIVLVDLGLAGSPAEQKGVTYSEPLDGNGGFKQMFEPAQCRAPAAPNNLNKEKCKDTLRFAAVVCGPALSFWVHVYEVGPLPSNPSIRLLAKAEFYPDPEARYYFRLNTLWISEDRLFLKIRKGFIVWDYTRGLSASWTSERLGLVEFARIGEWVIGTTTKGVHGWKIPPLQNMGEDDILGDPGAPNSPTPHFRIQLDEDVRPEVDSDQGLALSTWWRAHRHHESERGGCTSGPCLEVSIVYHVLGTSLGTEWLECDGMEDMNLSRYDLGLHIPDDHNPGEPVDITESVQCTTQFAAGSLPEMITLYDDDEMDFPGIPHHSLYDCSGIEYALFMLTHRRTAELVYSPMSLKKAKKRKEGIGSGGGNGDDEAAEWNIIDIAHEEEHAVQSATLCPWSGRMVYICGDKDMHERTSPIHVLDFSWEVGK